jgi:hypothetical protein
MDTTAEEADAVAHNDDRILVVAQGHRGKLAAVARFLSNARNEICVVANADVFPEPGCLESLCRPLLEDAAVGMTGARLVPHRTGGYVQRVEAQMWDLHHRVACLAPKLGPIVAMRNTRRPIPLEVGCDEVVLEAIQTAAGLHLAYAPSAVVRSVGPTRWAEYLGQRRRVHLQHLAARDRLAYEASTMSLRRAARAWVAAVTGRPWLADALVAAAACEAFARLQARRDSAAGATGLTWEKAASSRVAALSESLSVPADFMSTDQGEPDLLEGG